MFVSNLQSENEQNNLAELRQFFMVIDTNKDGILTADELQQAISEVLDNASATVVRKLFNEMDLDNNGLVEYNEFLAAAAYKESLLNDENLLQAFRKIDANHDGYIT